MEKPQYIDWIVEETGIVIKDDIRKVLWIFVQIHWRMLWQQKKRKNY